MPQTNLPARSSRRIALSWSAAATVLLAGCSSAPTCPQPSAQLLIPTRPAFRAEIDSLLGLSISPPSSPSAGTTPSSSTR